MKPIIEKNIYKYCIRVFVLLNFAVIIAACDGTDTHSNLTFNNDFEETGSLAFGVVWHAGAEMKQATKIPAPCGEISYIKAILYDNDLPIITGGLWDCDGENRSGTIKGVPVDRDLTLVIQGIGQEGGILYYGKKEHVSVAKGQSKRITMVDVYYVKGLKIVLDPSDAIGVESGRPVEIAINATSLTDRDITVTYTSDSEVINKNAEYNPADGSFTCPTHGLNTNEEYTITFSATIEAFSVSESIIITVYSHDSIPPEIEGPGDITVTEGDNIEFTISATDEDSNSDDLIFYMAPDPEDISSNADFSGATFSWFDIEQRDDGRENIITLTFFVEDEDGNTDQCTVTITILQNNAPYFTQPDAHNFQVHQGDEVSFSVAAEDPEDESIEITYAADESLENAYFNKDDNHFSWEVPDDASPGTYTAEFEAKDQHGNSSSMTVSIDVLENEDNDPPVVNITSPVHNNETFDTQGGIIKIIVTAADISGISSVSIFAVDENNNQSKAYQLESVGDNSYDIRFNIDNHLQPGRNRLVITATDAAGNQGTAEFFINYDNTTPIVTKNEPEIEEERITLSGTAEDDISMITGVSISIDDDRNITRNIRIEPDTAVSWSIAFRAGDFLLSGDNTLVVTAIDEVGNQGSVSFVINYSSSSESESEENEENTGR